MSFNTHSVMISGALETSYQRIPSTCRQGPPLWGTVNRLNVFAISSMNRGTTVPEYDDNLSSFENPDALESVRDPRQLLLAILESTTGILSISVEITDPKNAQPWYFKHSFSAENFPRKVNSIEPFVRGMISPFAGYQSEQFPIDPILEHLTPLKIRQERDLPTYDDVPYDHLKRALTLAGRVFLHDVHARKIAITYANDTPFPLINSIVMEKAFQSK